MSTWEERMSQRGSPRGLDGWVARRRIAVLHGRDAYVAAMFSRYYEPGDPDEILPEILAARCLGIRHGDPGPLLPDRDCRMCWGERYIWLGNTWGLQHVGGTMTDCRHSCHKNELWLAGS